MLYASLRTESRQWRHRLVLMFAMALQVFAAAADAETAVEVAVRNVQVSADQVIAAMDARGEDVLTMQSMKGVLRLLQGNNEDVAMIQFNNEIALFRYRALLVKARDCCRELRAAQAQAQVDDEKRQASDPAYRKEVEDRKAIAAKQQSDSEQVAAERRAVAIGFAVTKESAGDDPFLNYLLNGARSAIVGKAIRLCQAIPVGWQLPGNGEVAHFFAKATDKHTSRARYYRSRMVTDRGGALLFEPVPQTFPLGTVGLKRIQAGPAAAFETLWEASLNDQVSSYSETMQAFAKAHPQDVYTMVLDMEGIVSFHDDPSEMAGVSFTTVYIDQARLLTEPRLYDSKLQPVTIDKTITPSKAR